MRAKHHDYGWDIPMTYFRAIRVFWWKCIVGNSWRGIAEEWVKVYPDEQNIELSGNQFYGVTICDCSAVKLGFSGYSSSIWN